MSNSIIFDIIDQSQKVWCIDKGHNSLCFHTNSNSPSPRNDEPRHLRYSEIIISNWFEIHQKCTIAADELYGIFQPLHHNQHKQRIISIINECLNKFSLRSFIIKNSTAKYQLNLDSFNNILISVSVFIMQNHLWDPKLRVKVTENSKYPTKKAFAFHIRHYNIDTIIDDKNTWHQDSIHKNVLLHLHRQKPIIPQEYNASVNVQQTSQGILNSLRLKLMDYYVYKKLHQIPDKDKVFLGLLKTTGERRQAGNKRMLMYKGNEIKNWNDFYQAHNMDLDGIWNHYAELLLEMIFWRYTGNMSQIRLTHLMFKKKHKELDNLVIEIDTFMKNHWYYKYISMRVMCQSSGVEISSHMSRRVEIGHRLASKYVLRGCLNLFLSQHDKAFVNQLRNDIALVDSSVEDGDVNEWHLERYALFFGSKLWGNWDYCIKGDMFYRDYVQQRLETILTTARQDIANLKIQDIQNNDYKIYYDDENHRVPPYDKFIGGWVDKMMKVVQYKNKSFNFIGRGNGISFTICLKCGEPVIFDLVTKIRECQFVDLFPNTTQEFIYKRQWFLPLTAILHKECHQWVFAKDTIPDFHKNSMWELMKSYWSIFKCDMSEKFNPYDIYKKNSCYGKTINEHENLIQTQTERFSIQNT